MARSCSSKDDDDGLNCGSWSAREDKILSEYIKTHGVVGWRYLLKKAGLKRGGKSCRLRWLNYLRPDIKRGNISSEEEELLIRLHRLLGNRWSLIAGRLPGRTDNEIKNYWNTHLSKRVQMGEFEPKFQKPFKRRGIPSYSDQEVKADKDNYICQNIPVKTTAVRFCGSVMLGVSNHDGYNYDQVLNTHDGINPEEEGLKTAAEHVAEIDTSKSWCQLLFEDCTGDYPYDRLELINGLQANSIMRTDELYHPPSLSPCRNKILQENDASSSGNLVDQACPQSVHFDSTYLDSLIEMSYDPLFHRLEQIIGI